MNTNSGLKEAVSDSPQRDTRERFNPYPENVRVNSDNVFLNEKYIGYVDRVSNWGTDFLARCEHKSNKFFATKTEAVLYMASPVSRSATDYSNTSNQK